MKTLITLLIAFTFTINANAQFSAERTVKADHDSTTTLTFTDNKGLIHKLYIGSKGSLYYPLVSKNTGKYYRRYLSKDMYINSPEYLAVKRKSI